MKINVSYWGYSTTMVRLLIDSNVFNLQYIITQRGKYSREFEEICNFAGCPIIVADSKQDLIEACRNRQIDYVLVYCFGIIIPKELYMNQVIVNIHPGSLQYNRGAHALLWSVLLPGLGAEITAYKICCEEVDSGEVIASAKEDCNDDETPENLLIKLERNLPTLLNKIYQFYMGNIKTTMMKGGIYRERVKESDYTIDSYKDSKSIIKRKINSQSIYHGAIINENGKQTRIVRYVDCGRKMDLWDSQGNIRTIDCKLDM